MALGWSQVALDGLGGLSQPQGFWDSVTFQQIPESVLVKVRRVPCDPCARTQGAVPIHSAEFSWL